MADEKKLPVPKEKELWLMGFRILVAEEEEDGSMRKSWSMGNLSTTAPMRLLEETNKDCGYLSEGNLDEPASKNGRKRGIPWTLEEHRTFLKGLEELGKGDWRGISKNFVTTRTPTQVASHAQKYFLRQMNPHKRKRRSSLFDVATDNNWQGKTSSEDTEFTFRKTQKMEEGNGFPAEGASMIPLSTKASFSSHEDYNSRERIDGLHVFSNPFNVSGKVESNDFDKKVEPFESRFLQDPSSSSSTIRSGSGIRTQELLGLPMDTTRCKIQENGTYSLQCNDVDLSMVLAPPHSSLTKQVHSPNMQGRVRV